MLQQKTVPAFSCHTSLLKCVLSSSRLSHETMSWQPPDNLPEITRSLQTLQ